MTESRHFIINHSFVIISASFAIIASSDLAEFSAKYLMATSCIELNSSVSNISIRDMAFISFQEFWSVNRICSRASVRNVAPTEDSALTILKLSQHFFIIFFSNWTLNCDIFVILLFVILLFIILLFVILSFVILLFVILSFVNLLFVILLFVILSFVILLFVILSFVILLFVGNHLWMLDLNVNFHDIRNSANMKCATMTMFVIK